MKVLVSGGFDPIHVGHLRMFKEAKKFGSYLIVLVNNDNWLKKKKGACFMSEDERVEILHSIDCVDQVILTKHTHMPEDMSVCTELNEIRPDVFANGGDRFADNIPEKKLCDDLGITAVFNVGGGKVRSSSELVNEYNEKPDMTDWDYPNIKPTYIEKF